MLAEFNSMIGKGLSIIWGNDDWLILSSPWFGLLVIILMGAGVYFTVATRFMQLRYFAHMFSLLRYSREGKAVGGISSFEALMTSIAARVGTGNLAGVAIAIYIGGPGAVFWMWITALLGMTTGFIESTLAQAYKQPHSDHVYRGGPAYYMRYGLGSNILGSVFAICLLVAFGFAFNGIQSNTIAQANQEAFGIPVWMTGIALLLLVTPIIFGGLRSVAYVAGRVVPIMAVLYLLLTFYILAMNISALPSAIALIFKSAFGLEQAAGGVVGYGVMQAVLQGIKRGMFSNEAGMGTAPNAAASAKTIPDHPAVQGFMQMLGVFFDTIVVCTATASIIILSGVLDVGAEQEGIQLTQLALSHYVGDWGVIFVAIAIFFFSFTSIIAGYSYSETNLDYIVSAKNEKVVTAIFRVIFLSMMFIGTLVNLPTIWNFADLAMGIISLINLVVILLLSPIAFRILRDYEQQIKAGKRGKEITFNPEKFPKLKHQVNRDAWND